MSTRKISLYSSTGKVGNAPIESSAKNYDELKKELTAMGIDLNNKSVTEFTTQKELQRDSVLPEGDLRIYIMPAKVKSGL